MLIPAFAAGLLAGSILGMLAAAITERRSKKFWYKVTKRNQINKIRYH